MSDDENTPEALPFFVKQDLEDFRALMTRQEAAKWLARLYDELQCTFSAGNPDTIDRSRLGLQVHAIISQAGFLGFLELARLCSTLEEACNTRANLSGPFEQASLAAHTARRMIVSLQ